jgi:hypothetical protein
MIFILPFMLVENELGEGNKGFNKSKNDVL